MNGFFAQPMWLALMIIPLGLIVWYVLSSRVDTVEFSNPEFSTDVMPASRAWPRRIGIALWATAMLALPLVVAQPLVHSSTKENRSTVMVVLDVSTSMTANDVEPSRLEAAKAAIATAVEGAPGELNVGLVTLADHATLVAAPSRDHAQLLERLAGIEAEPGGTATGEGVFIAIETMNGFQSFGGEAEDFSGTIFLVSDGAEEIKSGERPLPEAASTATQQGYVINTVSYGTVDGSLDGQPLMVDPASLAAAASATGGQAYKAGTGLELQDQLASVQRNATKVSTTEYLPWEVAVGAGILFAVLVLAFVLAFIVDRR